VRLALWGPVLVVACGCARLETTVRTERGPVLETFNRSSVEVGPVKGELSVEWPQVLVAMQAYDSCREQTFEVLNEDTVTERSSNATGASLSMGIANVLASGVLFLSSLAVSAEPNRATIDVQGRYGPSTRQYVQGAGWVTIGIGVPALTVGVISALRSGESVERQRLELLAQQHEKPCNPRPLVGPVVLNQLEPVMVTDGTLELSASSLSAPIDDVRFFGRTIELDEGSLATLDALNACVRFATSGAELSRQDEATLYARNELLIRCRAVKREVSAEMNAISDELNARREGRSTYRSTPRVSSFDEAMRVFTPKRVFAVGSEDLVHLSASAAISGQAVVFRGVVVGELSGDLGVLSIGETQVFVKVPAGEPWRSAFVMGARLEGVALSDDPLTIAGKIRPLLRAVWLRSAF